MPCRRSSLGKLPTSSPIFFKKFLLAKNQCGRNLGHMPHIYVPNSMKEAGAQVRNALAKPINTLSKDEFVRAWSSLAYLFPGLHPDGFDDTESGWPRIPKRFATEAWRRANDDEI